MALAHEKSTADLAVRDSLTWKPLRLLSFYRLILAGLLTVLFYGLSETGFGSANPALYILTCIVYIGFSLVAGFTARIRRPSYETQAVGHVLVDILAITLLIHASGGPASGLGILLIITVATGSLLLPGRMAFLFAAVAAMAMFGEHIYSTAVIDLKRSTDYTQTGMLGIALFATAVLTYLMARRIHASESLAYRRGIDIANLAKLNAHIVQRLQAGIVVTDHRDDIRLMNETAHTLLGVDTDAENRPLAEVSPGLYRRLMQWRGSPGMETRPMQSEESGASILPQFTLLGTADGIGALIFLEDTATMQRQAQQMKLASLGRLTASIAHEIRNPLGAISHAAQLLKESPDLAGDDRRLTAIIGDHTRRVNTVVENVLQLSRPGTSSPQHIILKDWLHDFADEFTRSGNCSADRIGISADPPDLEAYMDPGQLHQVVWNLCQNAVHHGESDVPATIRLEASRSGTSGAPQLDILDNGRGIQPEMTDKIFEPFFTTRSSGTGLGLYIAREICESNQARLSYHQAPGGGSCFRIAFPDNRAPAISSFA
jgi:two-component system sensor histidine kinase PilS (NtrC family)